MIVVEKFSPEQWAKIAEAAHVSTFGKLVRREDLRIDFAIAAVLEGKILGWATCRETDPETLYWQFGGSLHDTRASVRIYRCMEAMVAYCLERYKRVHMLIENTNSAMLKIANKAGLTISGVRVFQGAIMVEHGIERGEA